MVDVVCIGQALVDCITKNVRTKNAGSIAKTAQSITLSVGGDALNQSLILSRLGHSVRTGAIIGQDIAGRVVRDALNNGGADVSQLDVYDDIQTVVADIVVSMDGSHYSISSDAVSLGGHHISAKIAQQTRILSFASLFRAPLDDFASAYQLAQTAKKQGAIICADTKMPLLREIDLKGWQPFFELVDFIFPNEHEAKWAYDQLHGHSDEQPDYPQLAEVFRQLGVQNVIIKAGDKGCYYDDGKNCGMFPALPVEAIDTTGAGDNFVSGFISALLEDKNIEECLRFASSCAAVCIGSIGTTTGLSSRKKAEDLYDRYYKLK